MNQLINESISKVGIELLGQLKNEQQVLGVQEVGLPALAIMCNFSETVYQTGLANVSL